MNKGESPSGLPNAGIFKWDKVSKCFHPQYEKYALDGNGGLLPGFVRLYTEEHLSAAYEAGYARAIKMVAEGE